ncbi:DUF1844 domain-containing protein [Thiovibrio frasassiensis]|jgi:hypothetical protein|uniref:DUF1844 domain-containing protein n=1 Tax=Thiovibrio frasassiensis TaxID=2984131 RepID=A0A9X4RN60_9BACT|nr:DUF1844 domain-containing protein [Thiovibrio frasassiensis]MDG4476933.1 DUF1844 domain-containing protein [Thiovibrio frasassiensis]
MTENEKNEKKCPEGYVRQGCNCVLPEVTFTTLVMSLNSSALYHMGEIQDPETGQAGNDLALAKHTISTLQLLKDRTRGNLTDKEEELLGHVLADLKLRYVKASS